MPLFVLKWAEIVLAIGILSGTVGTVFRSTIAFVTDLRQTNDWLLWLLPAAGVVIAALYRWAKVEGRGMDDVILAARSGARIPVILLPVVFTAATLTHLTGGSVGRTGTILQLGGGLSNWFGRRLNFNKNGVQVATMCGMAAAFTALFGTPVTASVFVIEAAVVGTMRYSALLPVLCASFAAYGAAHFLGASWQQYTVQQFPDLTVGALGAAVVVAAACGVVSIVFCVALHRGGRLAQRAVRNPMLRAALGGVLVIGLTYLVGTRDYNGIGEETIRRAIAGEAAPAAFALKLLFTVVTITAGFKGGEIVPCFFIGATLGCVLAPLLGLPASFGASVGLVAFFCGAVNCPLASMLLSIEFFGAQGIPFYALGCAVSYVVSGNFSLYGTQILVSSKLSIDEENLLTK